MEVATEPVPEKDLKKLSKPKKEGGKKTEKTFEQVVEESRRNQQAVKVLEKKLTLLQRERDQLHSEQTKSVLTRNRLEQLCRELQKQNKAMKEESLLRIREEEERRKEVSTKFHATLAEITALMQQNSESNAKLRDENLAMQNQFKGVCEQYELREQQVDKMSKQMKLEGQLADAKMAKVRLEMQAQAEILDRDKAQLMAELAIAQQKCVDHEKTEEALRQQINVYFEKYDEFQNVLTKSNQVYSGFKTEMDKMSKKMTRLEKETAVWKQKWESTHKALLALAAEKQVKDNEVSLQSRQLQQLQKLCRTLQSDRASLILQLTSNGLRPSSSVDANKEEAEPAVKIEQSAGPVKANAETPAQLDESQPDAETSHNESQVLISSSPPGACPLDDDTQKKPEQDLTLDPASGDSTIVGDETALGDECRDEKVNDAQPRSILKQPPLRSREGRRRRK